MVDGHTFARRLLLCVLALIRTQSQNRRFLLWWDQELGTSPVARCACGYVAHPRNLSQTKIRRRQKSSGGVLEAVRAVTSQVPDSSKQGDQDNTDHDNDEEDGHAAHDSSDIKRTLHPLLFPYVDNLLFQAQSLWLIAARVVGVIKAFATPNQPRVLFLPKVPFCDVIIETVHGTCCREGSDGYSSLLHT